MYYNDRRAVQEKRKCKREIFLHKDCIVFNIFYDVPKHILWAYGNGMENLNRYKP